MSICMYYYMSLTFGVFTTSPYTTYPLNEGLSGIVVHYYTSSSYWYVAMHLHMYGSIESDSLTLAFSIIHHLHIYNSPLWSIDLTMGDDKHYYHASCSYMITIILIWIKCLAFCVTFMHHGYTSFMTPFIWIDHE